MVRGGVERWEVRLVPSGTKTKMLPFTIPLVKN